MGGIMATSTLAYRDFVRICSALRRIRKANADPDPWFLRDALAKHFYKADPAFAVRLARMTIWEVGMLLEHVARHDRDAGKGVSPDPVPRPKVSADS
jgi:hypothetical protein